mgnify:FL=1|jgi:hypothetical protein
MNNIEDTRFSLFVILLILVVIYFICVKDNIIFNKNKNKNDNKNIEDFTVLDNDNRHTSNLLYDYLLTDGKLFYLYNSRDFEEEGKNPLIFDTLDEAELFRKKTSTPQLEVKNIVIKKNIDDPVENYERECSKKVADFDNRMNICYAYSDTPEKLEANKKILDDMIQNDNQLQACMIDKILDTNSDLTPETYNEKDIKYMSQFF